MGTRIYIKAALAHTFMTTSRPASARTRGAYSECLYASRLYLEKLENIASAGGFPELRMNRDYGTTLYESIPYARFRTLGTKYASCAWWNAAISNLNSFDI